MTYILKNKITVIFLLLTVLYTGCGYKQTNTQIRDVAFLKFNKSKSESYNVLINNKYTFKIDACIKNNNTNECEDNTSDRLYEITSGKTVIKVFDDKNNLLMEKEMYIGSDNTVEINLP